MTTTALIDRLAAIVPSDRITAHGDDAPLDVFPLSIRELSEVIAALHTDGVPHGICTSARPVEDGAAIEVRICLDSFDKILDLDEVSETVTCQSGTTLDALDAVLAPRGLELALDAPGRRDVPLARLLTVPGPLEWRRPSVGPWGDCTTVDTILPSGVVLHDRPAPRRATGPDQRVVGMAGSFSFGVPTIVTLVCYGLPPRSRRYTFRPASVAEGLEIVRALAKDEHPPHEAELCWAPGDDRPVLSLRSCGLEADVDTWYDAMATTHGDDEPEARDRIRERLVERAGAETMAWSVPLPWSTVLEADTLQGLAAADGLVRCSRATAHEVWLDGPRDLLRPLTGSDATLAVIDALGDALAEHLGGARC